METPRKILIVDDHEVIRAGLAMLLGREGFICIEAEDGALAIKAAGREHPDLIMMDLSMPNIGGIEACRAIKHMDELSNTPILILTVHEDEKLLKEAIRAGAAGYVVRRSVQEELILAIKSVLNGDLFISRSLAQLLADSKDEIVGSQQKTTNPDALTEREIEILRLLAQGYTNRQVGERLNMDPATMEEHRKNLSKKLNMRSRVELVEFAERHGLLGGQA